MGMYESDHTRFIREFLEKHPEELSERSNGRALWWDKVPCTEEDARREAAAKVPVKPYYYDAN